MNKSLLSQLLDGAACPAMMLAIAVSQINVGPKQRDTIRQGGIWRDRSDKRKSETRRDWDGHRGCKASSSEQAKVFVREETNRSVLNRESFEERKKGHEGR
jgi:hypothetical protein